jgi:D-alanine-D-alanine ligase
MENIVVLAGGTSEERDVSLVSSKAILDSLERQKYNVTQYTIDVDHGISDFIKFTINNQIDAVFVGLHGGLGENGKLQSLLDLMEIKYTGSGASASSVAMDKILSSTIAEKIGLDVPKFRMVEKDDLVKDFDLPFVIKPSDSGSSFGVSIVQSRDDIQSALDEAFKYSSRVMVQEFISGKELTVSILNNKVLPEIEIRPKDGWYDYKNKYTKGKTEYITDTNYSNEERKLMGNFAKKIFDYLGCRNYGRVDFRFDGKKFYFLEVNTLPGMTELSLTPKAASKAGINFDELIKNILHFAKFN